MSSPKSSINLSCLRAVFTNCTSFKPLCTKNYVPSNGQGSYCKNFFLPFSVWLYLFPINRASYETFQKRRHFLEVWYGARAVGASASHEISHVPRRYSALSVITFSVNLEPRSPTARRKGDLVKFDFEHAYCRQGPLYGPCCYCAISE